MKKSIGKCPFCGDGNIEVKEVLVKGRKTKVYSCSNGKWIFDYDIAELSEESTCGFRVFSNTLSRWGKKNLRENEIREILRVGEIEVELYSFEKKTSYRKWISFDEEYGVKVFWD